MSIDGEWGTVCGLTNFDDKAANVLCRQMKFTGGRALPMGHCGQGTGNIFIHNIRCEGNESSILRCPIQIDPRNVQNPRTRYYSRQYSCWSHETDAAVQCYDSARLVGSSDLNYGRLEVERNNAWTAVCDKGFDDIDAKVVCIQLGYSDGKKQCCSALGPLTPNDNVKIAITNVDCNGKEETLKECTHSVGTCESGQYVSVYCNESTITENEGVQFRIVGQQTKGIVQIIFDGEWGRVCNNSWRDVDAGVFCRQQGFIDGIAYDANSERKTGTVWINYINCNGHEKSILECTGSWNPGYSNCDDAAVVCYDSDKNWH